MGRELSRVKLPVFIFDFGGVVIKWKSNDPIFDGIAERYAVPREELRRYFEAQLPELEAGDISMREFLVRALAKFGKQLRRGDSPDWLWTEPFERLVKFRSGTVKVIESLRRRGYKVYLFSNTSLPHVRFLKRMGWDRMVDGFLTSCELGSTKPSPEAFERALGVIGVDRSRVVFIDDKRENVEGAKRFGMGWALWFTSLRRLKEDIAPIVGARGQEAAKGQKPTVTP